MKMPSTVFSTVFPLTVFLRYIHSDEKFIGTPPKEVLYLDVGIANTLL